MGQFKRTVTIKCPLEKAFDYVTDWQNLKSFFSNILDINPISLVQYGPGAAFETLFKVKRAEIPTTLEVIEFVKDKKMILRSTRGLKVRGGWEFKPTSEGTLITFSLEYELPPGMVRGDRDRQAIEQEFDESAGQSMMLLKWILESATMSQMEDWHF